MNATLTRPWRGWGPAPRPDPNRTLSYDPERRRLRITEGGLATEYALDDIAGADCEAYTLACLDDEDSRVWTQQLRGRESTCDCPESEKFGHKRPCAHVAALLALKRAGRLTS